MKPRKDSLGVVFDIPEHKYERFMDVYQHLDETDKRIDFVISKIKELPELTEGFGTDTGSWRGGDDFGGGGGGQSYGAPRHGRH